MTHPKQITLGAEMTLAHILLTQILAMCSAITSSTRTSPVVKSLALRPAPDFAVVVKWGVQ
jgi:hypothetical protein